MLSLLVDSNLIAHKALHTMDLTLHDNTPVGLIYGFLRQISHVNEQFKPDEIICVWDGGSAKRRMLDPLYKANRNTKWADPKLSTFHQQVMILHSILYDIGVTQVLVVGEESDDVIATISKDNMNNKKTTIILSSDHDYQQLVCDKIMLYSTNYGAGKLYTTEVIKQEYKVDDSSQLVDIYSLCGDKSDNIPGLPGIGPKNAINIINNYDTIEKLVDCDDLSKLTKSISDKILNNKDRLLLNKKLITMNKGVQYSIKKGEKNLPLVKGIFKDYLGFNYFLERWHLIENLK